MVDFSCLALASLGKGGLRHQRESRKPVRHGSRCQHASEVVGFQNIYIPEILRIDTNTCCLFKGSDFSFQPIRYPVSMLVGKGAGFVCIDSKSSSDMPCL